MVDLSGNEPRPNLPPRKPRARVDRKLKELEEEVPSNFKRFRRKLAETFVELAGSKILVAGFLVSCIALLLMWVATKASWGAPYWMGFYPMIAALIAEGLAQFGRGRAEVEAAQARWAAREAQREQRND